MICPDTLLTVLSLIYFAAFWGIKIRNWFGCYLILHGYRFIFAVLLLGCSLGLWGTIFCKTALKLYVWSLAWGLMWILRLGLDHWCIWLKHILKRSSNAKFTFYMLFEQKCVLAVCTQPPYNDKNPPSVIFLIPINNVTFLKSSRSQMLGCVTSHRPRPLPRLLIDTGVLP